MRELLDRHLAFCQEHSPPEDVHALRADDRLDPALTFFGSRDEGRLVAVGALKRLDGDHAELKSMHTAEASRRRGVGQAMLLHLLQTARERGVRQVSLETGTMPAFAPARALYAKAGFQPCGVFGDYVESAHSCFMTLRLA